MSDEVLNHCDTVSKKQIIRNMTFDPAEIGFWHVNDDPFQQRYARNGHAAPNEVSKKGDSNSVLPKVLSMNLSPSTPELE